MKAVIKLGIVIVLLASVLLAQTSAPKATSKKKASKAAEAAEVQALKDAVAAQQQQIKALSDQLQQTNQLLQQMQQSSQQAQTTAADAANKAAAAQAVASQQQQTVVQLKSDVADIKATSTSTAVTVQETQKTVKDALESPLAIHFKGITLTPGGYLAGDTVYRTRALGAEATPFNGIQMPGSGQNDISEFFGSGRGSRITLLAEGKIKDAKLSGYYESDFLSAGVTSNNNESNSYTLRLRQAWGQVAFDSGWSITGGQQWSLATETKKGVDNRTEALPMTIDPNYTVGFTWTRGWGFRVAKNFNNHFWLAASLENPQTIFTVTNAASNFALGGLGASASTYNTTADYSFNAMPDFILKAVLEPGFGHYELFGILSRFRDRVYPCGEVDATVTGCGTPPTVSAAGAYNDSKEGGGLGVNGRFTVAHHVDFGLHFLYGNGVGRYASSNLSDATVNPDGTLGLLRSYQALSTLEFHYPKFDLYFNGGQDYLGRRYSTDPISGKVVGYGSPTFNDSNCYTETVPGAGGYTFGALECSGQTQRIIEGTFGFWIKPYNGPKGRIQFGPQYSYITREAWPGTATKTPTVIYVAPHGIDNMIFTSFRYYLP